MGFSIRFDAAHRGLSWSRNAGPGPSHTGDPMTEDLTGKVVLVTGATDGLGRGVAVALARRGATLLVHGRSRARAEAVASDAKAAGSPAARLYPADFGVLAEVRRMADAVLAGEPRLDALVNNAGIIADRRQESADGHELTFQVNYLAGFLLTHGLLALLERSAPARIVNVASAGQAPIDFGDLMLERHWDGWRAYCRSKLAQIMMTFDLAEALGGTGVTVNALHPASLMPTKMVVGRFGVRSSLEEGVRNTVRLVADPGLAGVSGCYFDRDRQARAHRQAYDVTARTRLRELSRELCGSANR
jgi:NAD(P)-dependent dehydrogenase (short-subunit alcohol dehydrogenase family)